MAFTIWGEPAKGVQYEGLTVSQDSSYIGDGDSSYWAVVAVPGGEETDGEGWTFKNVYTGYYPPSAFEVDAPQEALEQYAAEQAAKKAAAQAAAVKRAEEQAALEAEWEAATPRKGKTVKVVKGRKVPVGTVGTCIWYGEGQWGYRVGIKVEGQEEPVWTAASNVEVIQPALVSA